MADRFSHDESGQIMVLPGYAPWKGHLSDIETEAASKASAQCTPLPPLVIYVLYQDTGGAWYVYCVWWNVCSLKSMWE